MTCPDIQEKLSTYLDGFIAPEEAAMIREHLSFCQVCRRTFEDLQKTLSIIKGLEDVEPPPWFKRKVIARIKAGRERKEGIFQKLFYPFHLKVPIQAFATIFIVALALLLYNAIQPKGTRIQHQGSGDIAFHQKGKAFTDQEISPIGKDGVAPPTNNDREKRKERGPKELTDDIKKDESERKAILPEPLIAKIEKDCQEKPIFPNEILSMGEKDLPSKKLREEKIAEDLKTVAAHTKPMKEDSKTELDKPVTEKSPSSPGSYTMPTIVLSSPPSQSTSSGRPTIDQAQRDTFPGAKAKVSISKFEDKSGRLEWPGRIGNRIAEMLSSALLETNRFIVIRPKIMEQVLEEPPRFVDKENPDLLIVGTITEFETETPDVPGVMGRPPVKKGSEDIRVTRIAMIVKGIDTRTGKILFAEQVEGKATGIGGMTPSKSKGLIGFLESYSNTPTEKAIKIATEKAVKLILQKTPPDYFKEP